MKKRKSKSGTGLLKLEETYDDTEFQNKIKEVEGNEKDVPTIDELMMQNINIFQDPEKGKALKLR